MLFFEGQFFVFLVVVLCLSATVFRSRRRRTWLLLVASAVFYAAWDPRFLLLIYGSTLVDFFAARSMRGAPPRRRRRLLIVSVAANLGSLAVFKYADFGVEALNVLLGTRWELFELTLPIGISFFTFQSMSYTIDVYRGKLDPDADLPTFALFVSFFPQLVAGPIVRAANFLPQVDHALSRWAHRAHLALPLFVFGLFKKVVVADHLGVVVEAVFADYAAFGSGDHWLALLAFSGQVYCDFSGYTDMALALCMLLGFEFPLNFRSPYLSLGPREFWNRWHISLSTWFRDYTYIPLGGSRHGRGRMYRALFTTMLLGGLWHGATWNYVAWGAYHGVLLVLERAFFPLPRERRLAHWIRLPIFHFLLLLGWILFLSESLEVVVGIGAGLCQWAAPARVPVALVAAGLSFVVLEQVVGEWSRNTGWPLRHPRLRAAVAGLLLPLCFLLRPVVSTEFIYFQF